MFFYVGARASITYNDKEKEKEDVIIRNIIYQVQEDTDTIDITLASNSEGEKVIDIRLNKNTGEIIDNISGVRNLVMKPNLKNRIEVYLSLKSKANETVKAKVKNINNEKQYVHMIIKKRKGTEENVYIPFGRLGEFDFKAAQKEADATASAPSPVEASAKDSDADSDSDSDSESFPTPGSEPDTVSIPVPDSLSDSAPSAAPAPDSSSSSSAPAPSEASSEELNVDDDEAGIIIDSGNEIQDIQAKEEMINNMWDDLTPVQRKNPKNVKEINNECDNIFALVDAYNETARDIITDTDGSSLSKILRKYTGEINNSGRVGFSPSLPLWILPVDVGNKKKIYDTIESTYVNVRDYLRDTNNNTSNRRELVRNFTRPFEVERMNGVPPQVTFSSLTQSIFKTATVINSETISAADLAMRTKTRNNVMQVFTPHDKVSIEKLCCLKDLRDYSRAFLPTTSIYDTILLTNNEHNEHNEKLNGVLQNNLQDNQQSNRNTSATTTSSFCDENLPSLLDNIGYVKSLVLKNPSNFNILLSYKLFVDKLNYNDFYWHNMKKKDLDNLKIIIKEYQKHFKNYLKKSTNYPMINNTTSLLTSNLDLFKSGNDGECGILGNDIINDYLLQKTRITNSEALNIIMNADYGDAYYKYSNFCNSAIAMMGGDLDIKSFTITQSKQLSGRNAINNLFGEERVVTDFERTDEENVGGKLNLSYVCLICDKSSDDKLCVNEGGRIDVGIIIKSIELLGYNPRVFPGIEESNKDTCYNNNIKGGNRDVIIRETVQDIFNARENDVAALSYVGSIIYSKNKYLTLRYDGAKATLLYYRIDNDNELITNVAFNYDSVLDLLSSIDTEDEEEEDDTDTFTIINVHMKMVIDDEGDGRSVYSESEQGIPEFATPSDEGSLIIPRSPQVAPPSESSFGSEQSEEEQEDEDVELTTQSQLDEYIENIQKSINDFDIYLCRTMEKKYKEEMIRSFSTLSRLRYMENSRLLKYQMDNYVRVSAIANDLYYNALVGSTSKQIRSVSYANEISRAFSDSSRCWSMIQDIANSLGDNYVEKRYSVENGVQVWLDTFVNEETVKVMPYYYLEISECIVYGVGNLNLLLNHLVESNSITINDSKYYCEYTGVDLNLSYDFNNDDNLSSSGTLVTKDTDTRPVSPIFIESTNSSIVSVAIKFITRMMKKIFTENILANTNEVNKLIRRCSEILIATFNKHDSLAKIQKNQKNSVEIITGLSTLVLAISLQSSSYFCKLRTNSVISKEGRKEGIPVLPLTVEDNKEVYTNLLQFILASYFKKPVSNERVGNAEKLKDKVEYFKEVMVIIVSNQDYLRDNTVSYEWYVKQWSNFSPPLFPLKSNEVSIPPSTECLKNIKYSNKFKFLHYIDSLAISGMIRTDDKQFDKYIRSEISSSNVADVTTKKTTELLREYEKLVDVCYNVPSTARFIVQLNDSGTKDVSQIKIFEFTDEFKKKFLEFYCRKGEKSVLKLRECEEFNVDENENNQEWFHTVLREVNKQHMIKKFNQDDVEDKNQSVDSVSPTNKVSGSCEISTEEYPTLTEINDLIRTNGNFINFIGSKDVKLNLEKCQLPDNIKDSFNNLIKDSMSIKGINYGSTHNFWQNNMSSFVNVMFRLWMKNNRLNINNNEEVALNLWYNCWKDNLKYMGYNSRDAFNAINDEVQSEDIDEVDTESEEEKEEKGYNKIKYLIQYLICMALASSTSATLEVKRTMHSFISYSLDEIKKNFNCIFKSDNKIEEELRNQKAAERRKHKTLNDGLDSNELRKRLKSAGIHEHLNAQRRRDLYGIVQ